MKRAVDICVLSDVHLGTAECKAQELLKYLSSIAPQTLILNGDFIDFRHFRRKHFSPAHLQVIQTVLQLSQERTKVYYITGEADGGIRKFHNLGFGNIHLREKLVLQLKGKRLWILHGGILQGFRAFPNWFLKWNGRRLDHWLKACQILRQAGKRVKCALRLDHWRLHRHTTKDIQTFEQTAIQLAGAQQYDYVICGYIHAPGMRVFENGQDAPVTYLNAGDWTQHLTALEYTWGSWTLFQYEESDFTASTERVQKAAESGSVDPPTADHARYVLQLFSPYRRFRQPD